MATTQTATKTARAGDRLGLAAAVCLTTGPLIMFIGDFLHPDESADGARQTAIIMDQPDRWYLAHLMLLVGFAVLIPGLLGLTGVLAARWPRGGYPLQVIILIGATGCSAIFAIEMLAGRLGATDRAATENVLTAFLSPHLAIPLFTIALGFFGGTMVLAIKMIRSVPRLRWPATALLVGIVSILAEIASSQVVLSQIGNVLVWIGTAGLAWQLRWAGTDVVEPA